MEPVRTEEVGAWMQSEHLRLDQRGVVAFDADGTIWSGDVAEDFVHDGLKDDWFHSAARAALAFEIEGLGDTPPPTATACLAHLFHRYEQGRYPSLSMCETIAWACAGHTFDASYERAKEALLRAGLNGRVRPEIRTLFHVAHTARIPIYVVSASPSFVVRAALDIAGLKVTDVLGVNSALDAHGVLQPKPIRPIPHGDGKVIALRGIVGNAPVYAAFGDNWLDAHLLREAGMAVAVAPKPKLVDVAHEIPGLRLLSP